MATDVLSVSGASTGRPYERSQRTKAMPKHTLFGAELERFDDKEKKEMRGIDLDKFQQEEKKERLARQSRYKSSLPDYLKKTIYDGNIEETKKELENRMSQANRAKNMLDLIEEKSKYFALDTTGPTDRPSARQKPGGQWMTEEDLKNSDKMNKVGVSEEKPGYNRDRYQQKGLSHQYSLIGDPMKLGMDFPLDEEARRCWIAPPQYKRHKAPDWLPKEAFMPKADTAASDGQLAVEVPPNIQHQHGTRVCQAVLGDRGKVEQTLDHQRRIRDAFYKPRGEEKAPAKFPEPSNPEYESLSQSVRQNVFPGYTINHKSSHVDETYTREVFDRRVPDPDQYRYQRDELTIWNEHNVLQDRMKRKWQEYAESQPKLEANWDRNAKRPPLQSKSAPARPKPKPKLKKDKEAKKTDNDFADVEFKTPPLTPPPPKAEKVAADNFQRDEAFWSFYDQ